MARKPKQVRFARIILTVDMPVCSRTDEEAIEIAKEQMADFFSGFSDDDWPEPQVVMLSEQPETIPDDATVWGECVPEEHDTVEALRAHLEKK